MTGDNACRWPAVLWPAVFCGLMAGCSSEPSSDAADPPTSQQPTESPTFFGPGNQQLSFLADVGMEAPDALVEIPVGFENGALHGDVAPTGLGWYVVSTGGHEFLGLSVVTSVEGDACRAPGTDAVTPGPSVEELADALEAQESTDATAPEPVTLAGYDGLYLELAGPADLGDCAEAPALWDSRGIYGEGQVDRVWVLDVDGQRVVVDASHSQPESEAADIEQLNAMVDSLEIVTAAR